MIRHFSAYVREADRHAVTLKTMDASIFHRPSGIRLLIQPLPYSVKIQNKKIHYFNSFGKARYRVWWRAVLLNLEVLGSIDIIYIYRSSSRALFYLILDIGLLISSPFLKLTFLLSPMISLGAWQCRRTNVFVSVISVSPDVLVNLIYLERFQLIWIPVGKLLHHHI